MTMPGFSAESSLGKASENHNTLGIANQDIGPSRVVPQFCYRNTGGGLTCCDCSDGDCSCTNLRRHYLE